MGRIPHGLIQRLQDVIRDPASSHVSALPHACVCHTLHILPAGSLPIFSGMPVERGLHSGNAPAKQLFIFWDRGQASLLHPIIKDSGPLSLPLLKRPT